MQKMQTVVEFEPRGSKSISETQDFLQRYYQNRCTSPFIPPECILSFESTRRCFEEYLLNPLKDILISAIKTGELGSSSKSVILSTQGFNYLLLICQNQHGNGYDARNRDATGKVIYTKKVYEYITKSLNEFIDLHVIPVVSGTNVQLSLKLTTLCYQCCKIYSENLRRFFSDHIRYFISIDVSYLHLRGDEKAAASSRFFEETSNSIFFKNVKGPLQIKIIEEINKLREMDWSRDDSSNVRLIDDDGNSYSILKQGIEVFYLIGGKDKEKTYMECIEAPFLESMTTFYSDRVASWFESLPLTRGSSQNSDNFLDKVYAAKCLETNRRAKCLKPSSDQIIREQFVLSCFNPPRAERLVARLPQLFSNLFNFEKYIQSANNGMAVEEEKLTAEKAFDLLNILDAFENDTRTFILTSTTTATLTKDKTICSRIGEILSGSLDRDFQLLYDKFKDPNKENSLIFDLAKTESAEAKAHLCDFYIAFFDLVDSYESIISTVCKNSYVIKAPVYSVFSKIANLRPNLKGSPPTRAIGNKSFSEALCIFIDCNLVETGKPKCKNPFALSSSCGFMALWSDKKETDKIIQKITTFVHHMKEKLEFLTFCEVYQFYRTAEQNFLLEKEVDFIECLRSKYGHQVREKLYPNIESVKDSDNFNSAIKNQEDIKSQLKLGIERTTVMIMHPNAHKSSKQMKLNLETLLTSATVRPFEADMIVMCAFYRDSPMFGKNTKKMEVSYTLGTCQVKFKKWTISMGTLQAIVLTAFNPNMSAQYWDSEGYITVEQFDNLINLCGEDNKLRNKILLSLVKSKLIEYRSGEEVKPGELSSSCKLRANVGYENKNLKVVIPHIRLMEEEKIAKTVIDEKLDTIKAKIVRVMKSRKVFEYNLLFAEVSEQLKDVCTLETRIFKKCVEDLVERDFLDVDYSTNVYTYLG